MEDIVEVAECGIGRVNKYLEGGYRLLSITQTNKETQRRHPVGKDEWFIRRHVTYTVGRTADVEPITFDREQEAVPA